MFENVKKNKRFIKKTLVLLDELYMLMIKVRVVL